MFVLILFLKLLLILLILLFFLIMVFLVFPFYYYFSFGVEEKVVFNLKVIWCNIIALKGFLDGNKNMNIEILLFSKRINLPFKAKYKQKKEIVTRKKEIVKRKKEQKFQFNKEKIKSLVNKEFLYTTISYVKKIIDSIKPKYFNLNALYGFDDPYITGVTSAFVYSIVSFMPNDSISINPYYPDNYLQLNIKAEGKIHFGTLFIIMISYVLNKNVRNKIKILIKGNF